MEDIFNLFGVNRVMVFPLGLDAVTFTAILISLLAAIWQSKRLRKIDETKLLGEVLFTLGGLGLLFLLTAWNIGLGLFLGGLYFLYSWLEHKLQPLLSRRWTTVPLGLLSGIVIYFVFFH